VQLPCHSVPDSCSSSALSGKSQPDKRLRIRIPHGCDPPPEPPKTPHVDGWQHEFGMICGSLEMPRTWACCFPATWCDDRQHARHRLVRGPGHGVGQLRRPRSAVSPGGAECLGRFAPSGVHRGAGQGAGLTGERRAALSDLTAPGPVYVRMAWGPFGTGSAQHRRLSGCCCGICSCAGLPACRRERLVHHGPRTTRRPDICHRHMANAVQQSKQAVRSSWRSRQGV